jgi:hypothetical protein
LAENRSYHWQTTRLQSNPEAYLDLLCTIVGICIKLILGILERFQLKVLRIIMDAPWYVPNAVIKQDLQVLSVRQEVWNYSVTYQQRLDDHPNSLAKSLLQRTHTAVIGLSGITP